MANITVKIDIFESDGTTPRENYVEIIGQQAPQEIVWQDSLSFVEAAMGGFDTSSFTLWKAEGDITAQEDDVVLIKVDEGSGYVIHYIGDIVSRTVDLAVENPQSDKVNFRCRCPLDARALDIYYRLIETDGGQVNTNIQSIYNDLFSGGVYTGKGQDNNSSITANSDGVITYSAGNNTLSALTLNAKYSDTAFINAWREIISIENGNKDLTAVERTIAYLKADGSMHTKAREDSTTPLLTVTLDTADFRVYDSDDLDDFKANVDRVGIINKVIINDIDYTDATSQYWTEIDASQTAHGIVEWRYESDSLTTDKIQEWVDGFILDMLEPLTTYSFTLSKLNYAFAPVWFNGGARVPDGYIKIENVGGTPSTVNAPFQRATYRVTSGGILCDIICGDLRPVLDTTAITTQSPFANTTLSGGVTIFNPDNLADFTTNSVPQFLDYVGFQYGYSNIVYDIDETNVKFILRDMGSDRFGTGGNVVKTFTSATSPAVEETSSGSNVFVVWCFNGDSLALPVPINGEDMYPVGYTVGGNDTQYTIECEVTVNVQGIDYVLTTDRKPFAFVSETRDDSLDDLTARMPDAEEEINLTWTGGIARQRFFTDEAGDLAPDGGDEGFFYTHDDITWVRVTGGFVGTLAGTDSSTFEINQDDSAETDIDLIFTANSGANKGAFRYDSAADTMKFTKNYQDGTPTWTDLTTGATDKITASFSGSVYELKVNSADGSLSFKKDAALLAEIDATGILSTDNDILPIVDDSYDLGSASLLWANLYVGNTSYTLDLEFSPDGGTTTYGSFESDATNNQVIPINVAIGFMDG